MYINFGTGFSTFEFVFSGINGYQLPVKLLSDLDPPPREFRPLPLNSAPSPGFERFHCPIRITFGM